MKEDAERKKNKRNRRKNKRHGMNKTPLKNEELGEFENSNDGHFDCT